MLKRFPILAKLPYKTVPLQPAHVNKELKVGELKPLPDIDEYIVAEYPKIVGTMIYIAITARPDVAFAVGKLSRGMYSPNKLHCDMLKDVVGYLATRSLYHCGTLASIRESRCYSPNWLKEAQP